MGRNEILQRTQLIYGKKALDRLASARVAVFGIGGVGGYVVEALARSGVGALDLIDNDTVAESNLNRQIIATRGTIGRYKTDVAAERVASINPDCIVRTYTTFYLPETQDQFDFRNYDYVVDAIDTVTGKLTIIENAKAAGVPVISSMGTGNKTDPSRLRAADIYETSVCPLARVMRRECKKRGINSLKVVFSTEEPVVPGAADRVCSAADGTYSLAGGVADGAGNTAGPGGAAPAEQPAPGRRQVPGSTAFVPAAAGLLIASVIVNNLAAECRAD